METIVKIVVVLVVLLVILLFFTGGFRFLGSGMANASGEATGSAGFAAENISGAAKELGDVWR